MTILGPRVNHRGSPVGTVEAQEGETGYAAFSISIRLKAATVTYIERQGEHHGCKTLKEEYIEFLNKHGIEYDERYVWG